MEETRFTSAGVQCAAWHVRPGGDEPAPCVVMAHGFSLTRHDGLATYAEAFAAAGAHALVFDHRHLGDSVTDTPQRFRFAEQRADWRAAVAHARGLDGVDPDRIVLWGFSMSGGHAVHTAAHDPRVAAVIALCPLLDGFERVRRANPLIAGRIFPRAIGDWLGRPVRIPVTGPPGAFAVMNLPGEHEGFLAAGSEAWRNEISPGLLATVSSLRLVRHAPKLPMPVWAGLGERDISVSKRAVERLAARAPKGELHRYDVDHFEPFHGGAPARIAADQADFLRRVTSGG